MNGVALTLLAALATTPEAGTYVIDARLLIEQDVALAGRFESDVRSLSLLRVDDDGTAHHRMCRISIEEDSRLADLHVRPDLTESTGERPARIVSDGGSWRLDLGDGGLGTEAGRVVDQDDDGHPGVTVDLEVAGYGLLSLYLVQRWRLELVPEGTEPSGVTTGRLIVRAWEQELVGSDPIRLRIDGRAASRPDAHRFRLARAAPGTSCATITPLPTFLATRLAP